MNSAAKLLSAIPASVRKAASEQDLAKDAVLFAQGTKPKSMHCVLFGEIRLLRTTSTGAEILLQRSREGFVAESSLDQAAYHCNAVATTRSRVLAIPRPAFQKELDDPKFRGVWIAYINAELRRARAQSERLRLRTARERIVHFIETEGGNGTINLGLSKKAWAAELGLTHEALYRALSTMIKARELYEPRAGMLSLVR